MPFFSCSLCISVVFQAIFGLEESHFASLARGAQRAPPRRRPVYGIACQPFAPEQAMIKGNTGINSILAGLPGHPADFLILSTETVDNFVDNEVKSWATLRITFAMGHFQPPIAKIFTLIINDLEMISGLAPSAAFYFRSKKNCE